MRTGNIFRSSVFVVLTLVLVVTAVTESFAKGKNYMYRKRAEWVKVDKLSQKQLGATVLQHPVQISSQDVEDMLLSLSLDKGTIFSKKIKEIPVFSEEEATKFAPFIADALAKASPNDVVNVSVVHKRPHFIIRSDFLSMINIFATEEGVHFYFSKLYARLDGDYEQASKLRGALSSAKSSRVSLKANDGQRLAYSGKEVVLKKGFDYLANSTIEREETIKSQYDIMMKDSSKKRKNKRSARRGRTATESVDAKSRLMQLEDLKKSGLITQKEYQAKRREILGSL